LKKLEFGDPDKDEKKQLKQDSRKYKRINGLLTPMSKYYASEMSMRVSNGAIAVLGGSGYMKDYPVERYLRDSRITTIYEGTSQLQVVAAVRGVASGIAANVIEELLDKDWPEELSGLIDQIRAGLEDLSQAVALTKEQGGGEYMELHGRRLVDMAISLIVGALFCDQARSSEKKKAVARYWLGKKMPELRAMKEIVCSGDRQPISEFEVLAGPVPAHE
jgi:hypothetical protein